MINFHPNSELLSTFTKGELPASLSAAIAIHTDMCPTCQQRISALTEQSAEFEFEQPSFDLGNLDIDTMISDITNDTNIELTYEDVAKSITVKGKVYTLPRAIQHMPMGKWNSFGSLSRARMDLEEGDIHSSLLQISPGGSVPEHTHKGYELTLLLEGSFKDEMGEYVAGDFILLDSSHKHNPVTEQGCLCFTVANDALHFTQGINKLLNPIASLIY